MMLVTATPMAHSLPEVGSREPIQDHWIIQWNGRTIGNVRSKAFRDVSHGEIESLVSLDDAPADKMLAEFFGPANHLIKLAARDFAANSLTLRVASTMLLDDTGRLESFTSQVYVGGIGDLFHLNGSATGTKLQVGVNAVGDFWPQSFPTKLLSREFDLPNEAFVSDAFSPPAHLTNLSVGKTWYHHTYRALSPNQPLQRVQAKVTSIESIGWQGKAESTFVVVLKNVANDLSVVDEEVGKMWVRSDGMVLRQSLRFGNLTIVFLREKPLGSKAHPVQTSTIEIPTIDHRPAND